MATAYYELGNRPGLETIAPLTSDHIGAFALHLTQADQRYERMTGTRLLSRDTAAVAKDAATTFAFSFPTDSDLINAWRRAEPYFGQIIPIATNPDKAQEIIKRIGGIQLDLVTFLPVFEEEKIGAIADVIAQQPQSTSDEEIIALRDNLITEDPQQYTTSATDTTEPVSQTVGFEIEAKQGQEMEIKSPGKIAEEIWKDFSRLGPKPKIPYAHARAIFPNAVRELDKQNDKKRGSEGKMMVKSKQILEYLITKHSKDTDSNAVRQAFEALMKGDE